MADENTTSRSILPRWELILLVLAVFIVIGIGLQKCGLSPMFESTEMTISDNPHRDGDRGFESLKKRDPRALQYTLDQVAKEFSDAPASSINADQLSYFGLEPDECRYFIAVYDQRTQSGNPYNASEWQRILKKAGKTYGEVYGVFEEVGMKELRKPSDKLYKEMEYAFGIPAAQCKQFARGRSLAISDWAMFVAN